MGYVAVATHLWPSNYSAAIKDSSAYLATVQTIVVLVQCRSSPTLDIDDGEPTLFSFLLLDIQNHSTIVAVNKRPDIQPRCRFPLEVDGYSYCYSCFVKLLTRQSIAPPIQLTR